ncbi:MAG: ROK family protein [Cyclobacteriaceae bacterium]|nr:ROK family protein [Cyclobacteriaceae bacterium]
MPHTIWGIDLGGTKAEGIILGPKGVEDVHFRDRVSTGADQGYEHVLSRLEELVNKMESSAGFRAKKVGIGTPGTLDPETLTMHGCNSECLNGQRLKDDLTRRLGMEVVIANDANCFALAETRLGAVKKQFPEAKVVFGVIMGTGVGGGLVVNGEVINGHHGIGGEWGHNFLDESGGPCYCGKSGCVEKIISGPSLESYYYSLTNQRIKLHEVRVRYLKGEAAATQTIERLIHFFGKAISVIINIIDPDVIVIGGGVSRIPEIYTAGLEAIRPYIFNNGHVSTPIVQPLLGDSAGVFGAAYLTATDAF